MKKKKIKNTPKKKKFVKQKQQTKTSFIKNKYADLLGLGLIILLGILIYSNSFYNSFHLDDAGSIVDNVRIRNLSDVKTIWNLSQTRFTAYYSFALNYHFGTLNVWGYHLVNLIIHLLNAALVYWLTLLIFSSPVLKNSAIKKDLKIIAFITALLFVSHPLATQSVTYIVQRMASLVALFYLLSVALYMKARLSPGSTSIKYSWFAGALISAVLAMMSKENAFTLPAAIVLVEIFFFQTRKISINFKDYRTILVIAGLLGFIVIVLSTFSFSIFQPQLPSASNDYRTITSANYLFTQFSVIVKYIQLLFLPINQNLDYDFPLSNSFFEASTIASFLFLLSLIVLAVYLFKKNRIISFGIFWFFVTLSIESSIIPISDLIFEHRTYLPSFGVFLILSSGIYSLLWNKHKYMAIAVFALIIGSNSLLTYERNKVWKDSITLWTDVISKSPNKARGYYNRGNLLKKVGKYNESLRDYSKAIELRPYYIEAFTNRGILLTENKRYDEALINFNKAIELKPDFDKAYNGRGNLYKEIKKFNEAVRDYSKAIEVNPTYPQALNNRASVYVIQKKYGEGMNDLNKAIELNPYLAVAYANRGVAELNLGNKENSCLDFKRAIDLGFTAVEGLYNQNCLQ